LFVVFSFDPFDGLSSFLLTLVKRKVDKQPKGSTEKRTSHRKGQKKRRQTIERVKRKVDKQSKGSTEKWTNNRKGQQKRGQTIERVKRKVDKQSKGSKEERTVVFSFDPFDGLSSFLLTLSVVCPLFF
jgi:hypothetical protein